MTCTTRSQANGHNQRDLQSSLTDKHSETPRASDSVELHLRNFHLVVQILTTGDDFGDIFRLRMNGLLTENYGFH